MDIDFGKAAKDYGRYRAGFPEAFFERLVSFGIGVPGQCVLDLGRQCGAQVAQFDVDLARLLAEHSPQEPLQVHHRVFTVIARAPSERAAEA